MNKLFAVISTSLLCVCFVHAAEKSDASKNNSSVAEKKIIKAEWLTDFKIAKASATKSGKPVFALFTGSDWCGWCVALHNEVLKTKEFNEYASKELVLFEADFPRGKKISRKIREQNQNLAQEYGIQSFPTVLILDANGKRLSQTGYQAGGGAKYVEHIKKLIKK